MPGLAVCLDGGGDDLAVLVLDNCRLDEPLRAMLDRVRVGRVGVRDLECDVPDAVPVSCDMPTDRGARPYLTAEHEPRTSRLEHILGTIAEALLRTAIGGARHPENGRVVVRGLLGVADQEMDEIDPFDRERVRGDVVRYGTNEVVDLARGHPSGAGLLIAHDWASLGGSLDPLSRSNIAAAIHDAQTTRFWLYKMYEKRRSQRLATYTLTTDQEATHGCRRVSPDRCPRRTARPPARCRATDRRARGIAAAGRRPWHCASTARAVADPRGDYRV